MNDETTAAQEHPVTPKPETKGILLGRVHDITAFTSPDPTRYVLGGIHYDPKGGFVEATDGKVLIRVPVTVPLEEFVAVNDKSGAEECIIPTASFKKALANVPKNGPLPILR